MDGEEHICVSCILKLPLSLLPTNKENSLENKLAGFFSFESTFLGYYETGNTIQSIVHSIKYKKNISLGFYIGEFVSQRISNSDFFETIDYLVPIPLHPKRLQQRTFNQSEKICEGISSVTSIPILDTAFERVENNRSQTKFSKAERADNVKISFR